MKIQESQIYMDVNEVANLLHKTPRTIKQMCYDKILPHYLVGNKRLFKHEEIEQWMAENCKVK